MVIIIDGYNLMKQRFGPDITEKERLKLTNFFVKYGKKRGHEIKLVFDGGDFWAPSQTDDHGVSLIYSGYRMTADDYIIACIEQHKKGELLIVSSDGKICQKAQDYHVVSMEPSLFMDIVQEHFAVDLLKKVQGECIKTTDSCSQDVDALMHDASKLMRHKNEDIVKERGFVLRRSAKHDKKMMAIMKKL